MIASGRPYPSQYIPLPHSSGTHEVDLCGFGLTLIKRQVIEALDTPKFRLNLVSHNGQNHPATDSDFCDRVKALGFKIKASLDHNLVHADIDKSNWLEFVSSWFEDRKRNPRLKLQIHNLVPMSPLPDNAPEILKEATDRLDSNYWVSAGTLLGLYREGDFIKGDTDIDLALEGKKDTEEMLLELFKDYTRIRTVHYNKKVQQLAFIKDGVILDIFVHWPEGENLVNYSSYGKTVMRADILRNSRFVYTKYGIIRFPNPEEEYLEIRYGADWRTPKDEKPVFEKI